MLEVLSRPAVYWSLVGLAVALLVFAAAGLSLGWFDAGQLWYAVEKIVAFVKG